VRVLNVREVHYPPPPTVVGDSPEEAQQAGVTAEGAVRPTTSASPASAILQEARDLGAGMIVVGSRDCPTGTPPRRAAGPDQVQS
jgi:nucleotide-binding universal stress UspA family protein